jgi:hypothetical protein
MALPPIALFPSVREMPDENKPSAVVVDDQTEILATAGGLADPQVDTKVQKLQK